MAGNSFSKDYFPTVIGGQASNPLIDFARRSNPTLGGGMIAPTNVVTGNPLVDYSYRTKGKVYNPLEDESPGERRLYQGSVLGRTWDGVTQVFEPFQIAQDLTFATIRGLKDENTSLFEQYSNLWDNLPTYFDMTRVAPRPTSGRDILGLYGVKDETVLRYGGLGLDIFGDPTLLGGFISSAGRITKGLGLLDAGNDLMKLGRSLDKATSIGGWAQGANRLLKTASPTTARVVEDVMDNLIVGIAKWHNPLATKKGAAKLSVFDWVLPERRALQLEFKNVEGLGGGNAGTAISQLKALSSATGSDLEDLMIDSIRSFEDLIKPIKKTWTKQFNEGIQGILKGGQSPKGLDPLVSSLITDKVYELRRGSALGADAEKVTDLYKFMVQKSSNAQDLIDQSLKAIKTLQGYRKNVTTIATTNMISQGFGNLKPEQTSFLNSLAAKLEDIQAKKASYISQIRPLEDTYRLGQNLAETVSKQVDKLSAKQEDLATFTLAYGIGPKKEIISGDLVDFMLQKFELNPNEARQAVESLTLQSSSSLTNNVLAEMNEVLTRQVDAGNELLDSENNAQMLNDFISQKQMAVTTGILSTLGVTPATKEAKFLSILSSKLGMIQNPNNTQGLSEMTEVVAGRARPIFDKIIQDLKTQMDVSTTAGVLAATTGINTNDIRLLGQLENVIGKAEVQQSATLGAIIPEALSQSPKVSAFGMQGINVPLEAIDNIEQQKQQAQTIVMGLLGGGIEPGKLIRKDGSIPLTQESMGMVQKLMFKGPNGKPQNVTLSTIRSFINDFNTDPDGVIDKVNSIYATTGMKDISKEASKVLRELNKQIGKVDTTLTKRQYEQEIYNIAYNEVQNQVDTWRKTEKQIYDLAVKKGSDPILALETFRKGYKIIADADTKIGEALSMVAPVKAHFIQQMTSFNVSPNDATRLWDAVRKQGLVNSLAKEGFRKADVAKVVDPFAPVGLDVNRSSFTTGQINLDDLFKSITGLASSPFVRDVENPVTKLVTQVPIKLSEVLENNPIFSRLSLDDLFEGEAVGHLRRTFGMMIDDVGKERFLKSFKDKKLVPSSMVHTPNVLSYMKNNGFEKEGQLITDYFDTLRANSDKGLIRSVTELNEYLVSSGVAPKRAVEAIGAFQKSLGSPAYQGFLDKARTVSERYLQSVTGGPPPGGTGASFYSQAVDFELESARYLRDTLGRPPTLDEVKAETISQLELLGELAIPSFSLLQQAKAASRHVPMTEFIEGLKKVADKFPGLVSDVHGDMTPIKMEDIPELGEFAGKYVNEFLAKEIHGVMAPAGGNVVMERINRIQNMVTSGMLSSFKSIAANVPGGIAMTTLQGLNPVDMIYEMARTTKDLIKAAKNPTYHFPDLDEFHQFTNLRISTLANSRLFKDGVEDIALDRAGLGKEGLSRLLDSFLKGYQKHFIEKPFGLPIGIKAFGVTENLMKISAFRVAKKMGFTPAEAAEIGRVSTFDQSQLPELLKIFKKFGGPFPGFPYFTAGRLADAAINHPGPLAAMDRLGGALTESIVQDESERISLYSGMDEWLLKPENRGVPLWISQDDAGNRTAHVIPLGQLFPTTTNWNESFLETAATLGILGPIIEFLNADISGDGEAIFSAKYGQRVYNKDSEGAQKVAEKIAFLYNAYAPASLKTAVNYNVRNQDFTGLIPAITNAIREAAIPVPMGVVEAGYGMDEYKSRKADKGFLDEVITATIRTSTPVTLEGELPAYRRQYEQERRDISAEIRTIKNKMEKQFPNLTPERRKVLAEKYGQEVVQLQTEFNQKWSEIFSIINSRSLNERR